MPSRGGENLFSTTKRQVLELADFIPTSEGIFRSWGLCPLRSVVGEEKLVENAWRNTSTLFLSNAVSCPKDKPTIWLERFIKHIF